MGAVVLPGGLGLEGGGVADEPVQRGEERVEGWPFGPLSLPALQHQGAVSWGAVLGGVKTGLVCYCRHHLEREMARDGGQSDRWRERA